MMHTRSATSGECARVRQQLSLRLDVERSAFEKALLESHLGVCGACRAFASDIEGFTGALRAAPLVELAVPVQLPPRQRRRRVSALGSLSAAATIAAVVLSAVAGPHFVRGRTSGSAPRPTHEFTTLMEQKLDRLGAAASQPAQRTPAGVAAAEQLAVGQVRGQPADSRTQVRHNGGR